MKTIFPSPEMLKSVSIILEELRKTEKWDQQGSVLNVVCVAWVELLPREARHAARQLLARSIATDRISETEVTKCVLGIL